MMGSHWRHEDENEIEKWFFVVDCRGNFEAAFPEREGAERYVIDLTSAFGETFTILERPRDYSLEVLRREGLEVFKSLINARKKP